MSEMGPKSTNIAEFAKIPGDAMQRLLAGIGEQTMRGPAPVHLWNPPYCGAIDIRITTDGQWHYNGSPIRRPALAKLFASILRRDPDGYVLVTPVERVGIVVDDAPFLAVDMVEEGRILSIRTNLDDIVTLDDAHPMTFEFGKDGGVKPYILVRGNLRALATRALALDIIERAENAEIDGRSVFGVRSGSAFFTIGDPP